jgi:hypothetical protein
MNVPNNLIDTSHNYTTHELTILRNKIEKLDKIHHSRIFSIIKQHNVLYTTNSNGVFVNLTPLDADTIYKLEQYNTYVILQEKELTQIEMDASVLKKEFYKDNKDK